MGFVPRKEWQLPHVAALQHDLTQAEEDNIFAELRAAARHNNTTDNAIFQGRCIIRLREGGIEWACITTNSGICRPAGDTPD
jgi:hypothetical protein